MDHRLEIFYIEKIVRDIKKFRYGNNLVKFNEVIDRTTNFLNRYPRHYYIEDSSTEFSKIIPDLVYLYCVLCYELQENQIGNSLEDFFDAFIDRYVQILIDKNIDCSGYSEKFRAYKMTVRAMIYYDRVFIDDDVHHALNTVYDILTKELYIK